MVVKNKMVETEKDFFKENSLFRNLLKKIYIILYKT